MKKSNSLLFALCALLASVLLLSACGKTEYEPFKVYYKEVGPTLSQTDPDKVVKEYFTNMKILKNSSSSKSKDANREYPEMQEIAFPDGTKSFSLKEVRFGVGIYESAEGETVSVGSNGKMYDYTHPKNGMPMKIEGIEQITEEKAIETAKTYFEFFYGKSIAEQYEAVVQAPVTSRPYLDDGVPAYYAISFSNSSEGYQWGSMFHVDVHVDGTVLSVRDVLVPAFKAEDIPTGFADKVEQAVMDCVKDVGYEVKFEKVRLELLEDGHYACRVSVTILADEAYVTWGFTVPIE